jgi:chorismate mutase
MSARPANPTTTPVAPVARSVRAVRGAIQVDRDEPALIGDATRQLLTEIMCRNQLTTEDLISVFFTATPDLTSAFPASAARDMGFGEVPLMCATEIDVPDSIPRVVRVMAHVYTKRSPAVVRHVYLGGAAALRPEFADADADAGAHADAMLSVRDFEGV